MAMSDDRPWKCAEPGCEGEAKYNDWVDRYLCPDHDVRVSVRPVELPDFSDKQIREILAQDRPPTFVRPDLATDATTGEHS